MSIITKIEAGEHVLNSYMPYAVSTIVDRALPDVRDGLKPVHRRILNQMKKGKMIFENERAKTVDPIAQTMKIHHHGDSSILDAIALMTEQNESLLHPFIDGEGAFGKVYSKDKPTPPRYTYCRLNKFAEEFFKDVDDGVITMVGEDKEHMQPLTLSSDFPNILVKNNKGIACGEACDFPSFNLNEICDASSAYIDDKDIDLFDYIKGIDFPTGAKMIFNKNQLKNIYDNGRGKITLCSKYSYLEDENIIEIHEIPYNTTIDAILEQVFKLIKNGESIFKNITDIRDETGFNEKTQKEEMKIAIDIKKNTNVKLLINQLFKKTSLQTTYSANMNCLVNCEPKVLGIKAILNEWIIFRKHCIIKSLELKLNKQKADFHLLSGLQNILLDTDKCINIIKNSLEEDVISNLMSEFNLDIKQSEFVAEMKLKKINKITVKKELLKIENMKNEISELESLLNSEEGINRIIKKGLEYIKTKYGKPRKTEIIHEDTISEIKQEDLIEDFTTTLILTEQQYFKKTKKYSENQKLKEDDNIKTMTQDSNKNKVMFLSDKGNMYLNNLYELDENTPSSLGQYLPNLLPLDKDETILGMISSNHYNGYVLIVYEDGHAVKIPLESYKTKTNRTKLSNCLADITPILITQITDDINIELTDTFDKTKIIKTEDIPIKTSRNSQGKIMWCSKKQGFKVVSAQII